VSLLVEWLLQNFALSVKGCVVAYSKTLGNDFQLPFDFSPAFSVATGEDMFVTLCNKQSIATNEA